MKYEISNVSSGGGPVIAIRCPNCGHNGTFKNLGQDIYEQNLDLWFGQRKCPNPKCKGHIFFISDPKSNVQRTYPSDTISFEKTGVPAPILNAFQEAITCHSNQCFTASAIMIRKTLEVICDDRQATGKNLKSRLQDLGGKIMIPKELVEGMDELRLLGNDAAHIEAKTFDQTGKDEIEISIEFTKEILKAVYQYDDLLSKLRKLKKDKSIATNRGG